MNAAANKTDVAPAAGSPTVVELVTFEIKVDYFPTFTAEFAKLSRKAAKLGVLAPSFEIVQRDKVYPAKVDPDTNRIVKPARVVHVVKVTGQAPRLAGWLFVAALQHEEAGNIVRTVPGVDLQVRRDLRSAKPACEHCNMDRRRKDTYVVAHDDGRQMQVGRTCLRDFTGHDSPEAIARWAELLGAFASAFGGDDDDEGFGGGYAENVTSLDEYMPFVCANIRVQGWLSRTKARDQGGAATADGAWMSLFPASPAQKSAAIKPEEQDKARAAKCLEWTRAYFDARSTDELPDYEHNLRIVIEGLSVRAKTAGIVASVVNFAERGMGREIEQRKRATRAISSAFIGEVGKRGDFVLTVEKVIDIDSMYGVSHLHVMADAAGNTVKWFGSSRLETGETYTVRGTVKKHEEYKGEKQTLITRCKCEKFDPSAPAPAPKAKAKRAPRKPKAATPAPAAPVVHAGVDNAPVCGKLFSPPDRVGTMGESNCADCARIMATPAAPAEPVDPDAWKDHYLYCYVCGFPVPGDVFERACKRFTGETCSLDCIHQADKNRYACCPKAERLGCVCLISFRCPDHGDTHVGTHD